jgi:hypothetical protein
MNERIRELIEQATTEEHDGFRYFDKKKFAELIVEEYTEKLVQHGAVSADGTIVKDIQKHFGVER